MLKAFARSLALLCIFVFIAAPGGGGGGGGGSGGGGGGGDYVSGRWRGYTSLTDESFLLGAFSIVMFCGGYVYFMVTSRRSPKTLPYRTYKLVLLLKSASKSLEQIENSFLRASFGTGEGRTQFLKKLLHVVEQCAVEEANLFPGTVSKSVFKLGNHVRRSYRKSAREADVELKVVKKAVKGEPAPQGNAEMICLSVFMVTAALPDLSQSNPRTVLRDLSCRPGDDNSHLWVLYSPQFGERMSEAEARETYRKLGKSSYL